MFTSKSPFVWLSISLTCCALALGLIPQLRSDAVLSAPAAFTQHPVADVALEASAITVELFDGSDVYKNVEQMPLFPGKDCGDITKYKKRKQCADLRMLDYVYDNIRYPKKAKDKGVQGMAVVRFVVEPYGAITDIKVVRDPGAGLGKAVTKVVKKMKEDGLRWEPALKKGKPVRFEYNLPVKFKLE